MRNSNIEILRIFLIIGIFVWHILIHGCGFKDIANLPLGSTWNSNMLIEFIACVFLCPAVNCFVFISGYYGSKFKIERIVKFMIQALFISLICLAVHLFVLNDFFQIKHWTIDLYRHIFPISCKMWWFLTDYIMLLLISPMLNKGISSIDKKTFGFIVFSLLFINSFGYFISFLPSGSNFQSLLILYLLGRYISVFNIRFSTRVALFSYVLSALLLLFLALFSFHYIDPFLSWYLYSYNNPLIIIMSIGLFFMFANRRFFVNKKVNFIASHVFAIYLLTEGIGLPLYKLLASNFSDYPLFIVFSVLIIAAICVAIDWLIIRYTQKTQNLLVLCYSKISCIGD